MDMGWIEDYLSLANSHSFSRAAIERNVTQSALSKRIRALEQWVGVDLIDRSTYPVELTPAGKVFLACGADVAKRMADTRAALRTQSAAPNTLRIAAGHSLAVNVLPQWLMRTERQHGRMYASVSPGNVHDSILSLAEGNCDLLMCYHHPALPVVLDDSRFEGIDLGDDEVLPVSAPSRSGQPAFALPGTNSAPVPYLSFIEASYFGRVVGFARSQAGQPCSLDRIAEADMVDVIKALAIGGAGLAWLPASAIRHEVRTGQLVGAGGPVWSVPLKIRLFRSRNNPSALLDQIFRPNARVSAQPS